MLPMKKTMIAGAVFGLLIAPLSTLGLGSVVAMVLFVPFTMGPRWVLSLLADAAGFGPSIGLLLAVSAAWYAVLGGLLGRLFTRKGRWPVVAAVLLYYLAFAVFGTAVTRTSRPADPSDGPGRQITSFEECLQAGNPVMESYPRQCRSESGLFVEDISDRVEKEAVCDGPPDVCPETVTCSDGFVTEDVEVCGRVNVVCIQAPCDPVEETFRNRCEARDRGAFDLKAGSCEYWREADTFIQTQGPVTYSIAYPRTWFQHETGQGVIFTKDAAFETPSGTEGYAIGPHFSVIGHDLADGGVESYEEWLDLHGMTAASGLFVSGGNVNVNGYQMRRVVAQAAGAGGQALHYVFFVDIQRILVFSHYPYDPATDDTRDFEAAIRTFTIEDREVEIVRSAELIEMKCRRSSDCVVPIDYAVQSNCPYGGVCVDGYCGVICPTWRHDPDPEVSVSYQVECSADPECDCSGWDIGGRYECGCFDGQCGSLVLHKATGTSDGSGPDNGVERLSR